MLGYHVKQDKRDHVIRGIIGCKKCQKAQQMWV